MTKDVVAIARTVLERHSTQEGALLPILRDLQDEFGYLPEPVFPLVAETLNLSRAEVYGVATFYHDFHLRAARGAHDYAVPRRSLSIRGRRRACRTRESEAGA